MLPTEDFKLPGKQKFRPKMGHKLLADNYPDTPGENDEGYFQEEGKFPVFMMRHKKIVLGDTGYRMNRDYGKNKMGWKASPSLFHKIPEQFMHHTTFIVEAPQWTKKAYKLEGVGGTQKEAIRYVDETAGKKNKLVCADGRVAYDNCGKLHRIIDAYDKDSYLMVNHEEITKERVWSLADRYLYHVLLKNSGNVNQFVTELTDMISSSCNMSPKLVIQQTTDRVRKQVSCLTKEQCGWLKAAVMDELEEDLTVAEDFYEQAFIEFRKLEVEYQVEVYEKLAELMPKKDLLPPKAYQKLVDEITQQSEDAASELRVNNAKRYNMDILSALVDIFSNVLLLAEVAGASSENMVVVYGASHQRPLRRMIEQFRRQEIQEHRKLQD